jgi:hypothetical protein
LVWPIASIVLGADTTMKGHPAPDKPKKIMCYNSFKVSVWPVIFLTVYDPRSDISERLVTLDTSRVIGNHSWKRLPLDVVPPYKLKVDARALELSQG